MHREQLSPARLIWYLLYLIVLYALQTSLFGTWSWRGFRIDLLPAVPAAAALLGGTVEGALVGAAVGLFYDIGLSGVDGVFPLVLLGLGLAAGALCQRAVPPSGAAMVLLSAGFCSVLGLLRYLLLLQRYGASFGVALQQLLGSTVLCCVLCFVVYLPMRAISRRV